MSALTKVLVRWPTHRALQVASLLGLVGLAFICWAVLNPTPIPVVASMSLSPVFGGGAFLLFGVSIAADVAQARARSRAAGGTKAP